ncbi:hypothetical protein BDP81DRAFT_440676 [Colletotrichum phormii]|uniref:Uncharacterized protein n=1 Tax=Colletotrichum phormii TaxID=359342 RepID=A0AAI9ZG12_9PEZI|nr:uncharacterized protein BDP81DRAFT_440676 [Colletotrichum phormii]KAK1622704.1 hypothetical protein BDP81DRAFT_440676 [Colletotrichum phormii]
MPMDLWLLVLLIFMDNRYPLDYLPYLQSPSRDLPLVLTRLSASFDSTLLWSGSVSGGEEDKAQGEENLERSFLRACDIIVA